MPAAHNTPGFTSFSDYLDANAGSLAQERAQGLAGAQAAGQTAQGQFQALLPQAYAQGASLAKSDWELAHPDAGAPVAGLAKGDDPFAPRENTASDTAPGQFDVTSLPGYSDYLGSQKKASDAVGALTDPSRAQDKYTPFESSLLGADTGYQGAAAGLQKQYGGGMSDYLDQLTAQGAAGAKSYKAPTLVPQIHVEGAKVEDPLTWAQYNADHPRAAPVEPGGTPEEERQYRKGGGAP